MNLANKEGQTLGARHNRALWAPRGSWGVGKVFTTKPHPGAYHQLGDAASDGAGRVEALASLVTALGHIRKEVAMQRRPVAHLGDTGLGQPLERVSASSPP